jgi:iron transport multicopper oxidase
MDGASMISQCPIPTGATFVYDFQIGEQIGTYWYHSHSAAQYGDGLRGAFIIEDDNVTYDGDMAILLSDWYHTPSSELLEEMFRHGSKGHEPRIDSGLFNETEKQSIFVQKDKTYLLRLINAGMSATQYFYIEDHPLTIVEVDGVKVEPVEVEALNIATGQRYGVMLKTKSSNDRNYGLVQITNIMMNKKYTTNWLVYGDEEPEEAPMVHTKSVRDLQFVDDIELRPLGGVKRLPEPDRQLIFTYDSDFFGEYGTRYYTMNSHPHLSPRIPTVNTVFSTNTSEMALNPLIYGEGTSAFILNQGEIVELIINSQDHMRHPFHLHGHNFQVLTRGAHGHYTPKQESEFPEAPMIRDTVMVPGNGHVVIRFRADNPGVWFFHCHTEWHAVQGLGVVFIEAPDLMIQQQQLPMGNMDVCLASGIQPLGNAAGNHDLLNMTGEIKWPVPKDQWVPESEFVEATLVSLMASSTKAGAVHTKIEFSSSATSEGTSSQTVPMSNSVGLDTQKVTVSQQVEILAVYITIMITIAGIVAVCVQRGTHRKKKSLPMTELEDL